MTRPKDMGPADLAPNTAPPQTITARDEAQVERNAFYNSLPIEAKERFLSTLEDCAARGLGEEAAWAEASAAVMGTY